LAWLWFNDLWWAAALIAIGASLAGWLAKELGTALLPGRPRWAVDALEWWILTPGAIAAAAAAVVVIVTVELTVPEGTATTTKELVGALSTGLTAFVTAAFISWAGDEKDSKLGSEIRKIFFTKYKRAPKAGEPRQAGVHYFATESAGERWVYSDKFGGIEGWGGDARRKRADEIAKELRSGASNG
jgi:hypothetical protein